MLGQLVNHVEFGIVRKLAGEGLEALLNKLSLDEMLTVHLCTNRINFDNPWAETITCYVDEGWKAHFQKAEEVKTLSFLDVCNEYSYQNCWTEMGTGLAYYVPEDQFTKYNNRLV